MSQLFFGKKAYNNHKLYGNIAKTEDDEKESEIRNARAKKSYFIDNILRIVNSSSKAKAVEVLTTGNFVNGKMQLQPADPDLKSRASIYITSNNGTNACIRIGAGAHDEKEESAAANKKGEKYYNVLNLENFTTWFNSAFVNVKVAAGTAAKKDVTKGNLKSLADNMAKSVKTLSNKAGEKFGDDTIKIANEIEDANKSFRESNREKKNIFRGVKFTQ